VDVNGDGKADLLVGSPFASVKNRTQNGMVTVLLSSGSVGKATLREIYKYNKKVNARVIVTVIKQGQIQILYYFIA
jgi:hypothetical protein